METARFSGDGKRVVTASEDNTGRVWDAATGDPLTPALRHRGWGQVRYAAFSPDSKQVITSSRDMAWVWDAQTGKELKKVTIAPK